MKRSLITGFVVAAASAALAGPASAATCQVTDFMQDGRPLTAAQVNPPATTGTVDATGCDIAIYFNDGAAHTVDAATVQNAFYYGVLTNNEGTSADITNSEIRFIGDGNGGTFLPTGAQHGVGVAFRNGADGLIDNDYIHHYQKNGVLVNADHTTVTTTHSHVQGLGPVMFIAQNGVQYSNSAEGEIRDNLIEDNEYTGPMNTFSTGLLLFNIEPPEIKHSLNLYRDNDRNLVMVPSSSLK
jgi:hypothetical protein